MVTEGLHVTCVIKEEKKDEERVGSFGIEKKARLAN